MPQEWVIICEVHPNLGNYQNLAIVLAFFVGHKIILALQILFLLQNIRMTE